MVLPGGPVRTWGCWPGGGYRVPARLASGPANQAIGIVAAVELTRYKVPGRGECGAGIRGRHHDWLGKLGFGGIVDGEHFFILDRNADDNTHLTHGERYSGALVALAKPFLNKERNQAAYGSFNRVLKQRVENLQKEQ